MKKLKLMLDALAVDTFATVEPVDRPGTMLGQEDAAPSVSSCEPDVCMSDFNSCFCTGATHCC